MLRRWIIIPVGGNVRRINLSFFMDVGIRVDALARWEITTATPEMFKSAATLAREILKVLIQPGLNPMQIPATVSEANNLIMMINDAIQKDPINSGDVVNIWIQAQKVQTLLQGPARRIKFCSPSKRSRTFIETRSSTPRKA